MRPRTPAMLTIATLALSGCAAATSATSQTTAPATQATAPPTQAARSAARPGHRHRAAHHRPRRHTGHPAARPHRPSTGLPVSTASNTVVQRQPAAGSCHQMGSGPYSRPDPGCTPGALNPQVTQATIDSTICATGWTETVRPPESVTEQEKVASVAAYGDSGPLSAYEYDHFVPLELGGATNDPRNLWPEPGGSPNPKDAVENELRRAVCDGQMTLAAARHAIVTNWVALARQTPAPTTHSVTPPRATSTPHPSAGCTVTASYNSRYHDYDVYVHSGEPDATVTVTDASGRSRSWHTDGAGTADVYFTAPRSAAGEAITVRVGAATCSGTL